MGISMKIDQLAEDVTGKMIDDSNTPSSYEAVDVAAIRKELGLSQSEFAKRFGLPPATVRDWEQSRRSPDRAAVILLKVIAHDPNVVMEAVNM